MRARPAAFRRLALVAIVALAGCDRTGRAAARTGQAAGAGTPGSNPAASIPRTIREPEDACGWITRSIPG